MSKPFRSAGTAVMLVALAIHVSGRLAGAEDAEKPPASVIEEKRAEVKKLGAAVEELRESFRRWRRSTVEDQEINTRMAEANYQNAKLTRQVAEIAVIEYEQGTYRMERQKADGELALAKFKLSLAEKDNPRQDPRIHKLELEQARYKLESAEIAIDVLEKYTKPRRMKDLESELDRAKSDEQSAEGTLSLQITIGRKVQQLKQAQQADAPEEKVLVLLRDSVALETKLKGVLEEVKALQVKVKQEPKDVEALATDLRQKEAEVANLRGKALRQLDEAMFWADEVIAKRNALVQAMQKLKTAEGEPDALQDKAK